MKKALSFKRVYKEGRYFRNSDFSLRVLENNLNASRLGISIQSRVFPKATQRNRIKRLVREVFRRHKNQLNKDYDIIIRPKKQELINSGYHQTEEMVLELFKTAEILKQE